MKLAKKRHLDMDILKNTIKMLCEEKELPVNYWDHNLFGRYSGFRECHLEPDWLLVYQVGNGLIVFDRTGTHSDIFD